MTKTAQERLNDIFERMAKDHQKLTSKQQEKVMRAIGEYRGDLADLLADYSDSDGTVSRRRLSSILRELDDIEAKIKKSGMSAMDVILLGSAAFATSRIAKGFDRELNIQIHGYSKRTLNQQVVRNVVNFKGPDNLILSDRVWRISGDIRDEISKVIRTGILRGDSVGTMIKNVRKIHDTDTWKIRRLVVTESNNAFRESIAMNAIRSKHVKALELHPGAKRSPACSDLSNEDRYGLGRGIFLPDDPDIYNPHPQCTSYLTYVLDGSDYED